jgi:uroporphyrin-III C-methyltransferase
VEVITHGCSPQQQVHVTQFNELKDLLMILKGVRPALIVMEEVVKLR